LEILKTYSLCFVLVTASQVAYPMNIIIRVVLYLVSKRSRKNHKNTRLSKFSAGFGWKHGPM